MFKNLLCEREGLWRSTTRASEAGREAASPCPPQEPVGCLMAALAAPCTRHAGTCQFACSAWGVRGSGPEVLALGRRCTITKALGLYVVWGGFFRKASPYKSTKPPLTSAGREEAGMAVVLLRAETTH